MLSARNSLTCFVLALASITSFAQLQDVSLLPKYGNAPKTEAQSAADAKFLQTIDAKYSGNRKAAANDIVRLGWNYLRQGNTKDAIRRFNQAWLLDASNAVALWGMAAVLGGTGRSDDSLKRNPHFLTTSNFLLIMRRPLELLGRSQTTTLT